LRARELKLEFWPKKHKLANTYFNKPVL
jgi:hypothetical protein